MGKAILIKDIGNLYLFNTQYKVKFKGMANTIHNTNLYIFESHGNLFGIDIHEDDDYFIIRNEQEILNYEITNGYKYEDELIIEDKKTFKNNIFDLGKTPFDDYFLTLKYKVYKEINFNARLKLNPYEFKFFLFSKNKNLDQLIKENKNNKNSNLQIKHNNKEER